MFLMAQKAKNEKTGLFCAESADFVQQPNTK